MTVKTVQEETLIQQNQKKNSKKSLLTILKMEEEIEENRLIIMISWILVSYQTNNRRVAKTFLVKLEKDKLSKETLMVKTVLRKEKLTWVTIVQYNKEKTISNCKCNLMKFL